MVVHVRESGGLDLWEAADHQHDDQTPLPGTSRDGVGVHSEYRA